MPKPERKGSRVSHRPKKAQLALAGELSVPAPPKGLLEVTQRWWSTFWGSDVAKALQGDTDVQALERLATLYDDRERTYRALRALKGGPVTVGSQDQLVLHPLAKYQAQLDAAIQGLEDRFGLNPRARLALGLQLTQVRRELEDLWNEPDEDETGLAVIELDEASGDVPPAEGEGG